MSAESDPEFETRRQLTTSERDLDDLAERLTGWLADRVTSDTPPVISEVLRPQSSGLSSTSVLFRASWQVDGRTETGSYVARLAPEPGSFPVFETYDLAAQYAVMAAVGQRSAVPVPPLCWLETDESVLGTAFFVMGRVDGRIPEDNPPYVFIGWLFDATPDERWRLARNTIDVIARLHAIPDPHAAFPALHAAGSGLRAHVDATRRWYDWALAADGYRIPLLERAFEWLEQHWPATTGPDVLSWGDSRPGNIIFDRWDPVAVLDWEMAAIGPRELDVAWLIFIHRFFQDIATGFDQPGLADFLRRDDVVAHYQEITGHHLQDMDFHLVYAALRHGVVMARIKRRMIHFGEDTDTPDRDDYIMHRATLAALLDGTYEWDRP
ncbi:phosphotransferase family protein [Nocardia sp. alder85J]|uniref:phosphotransferase family protein n=1 Tax=Nocardia sp. alder85J TaxID=2862949 RepID=UPI001CD25AC4|nr:phosphotransferase family protein [Nocardia sp. alder85J]MCX4094246.1 phosphotransferase family protein [Nocardia sp. alder85J]